MQTQLDVNSKITEAETCRSMQLFSDSLRIYEEILADVPQQDRDMQEKIEKRLRLLKQEIADQENRRPEEDPGSELDDILHQFGDEQDASVIFDKAAAFKEMGLHRKAVAEYARLFKEDFPVEQFISELTGSLLKLHSPRDAAAEMEALIRNQKPETQNQARIIFLFGRELEKRDQREPALELYRAAGKLDPDDSEIKKSLESLTPGFASGSRYDYLLRERIVTTDQLQKAFVLSKKMDRSVEYVLIAHCQVKKEAIGKSFSLFYDCPFREYDPAFSVPVELLSRLKETFLLNAHWVPMSWEKDSVEILVDDPRDLNKTDNIKSLLKTNKINFSVAIREDIQEYIKRFFDEEQTPVEPDDEDPPEEDDFGVEFEEEEEEGEVEEVDEASGKVVRMVDQIIIAAFRKKASDIHIEPSSSSRITTVRFRLDGMCQEYRRVSISMARGIVSRIKIMAKLNIAERRRPQDGKIRFRRKGVPAFELRVATIPVAGGYEDVVLRILASAGAMQIDEMGLTARNLEVMKRIIAKPYGLILAVGPTGSGKTTSLHALLGHINKPDIKIWTAEDPIEITQPGLRQTEVMPKIGVDFARLMRAFLRGDPDVIMIGEMRDEETASVGIEASLTGHLVFSTLHTNSAPETVPCTPTAPRKPSPGCSTWGSTRSIFPTPFSVCWPSG
jgi:type II secretory ATPase GspE/PulE/Tfp pilus assembly ATPase PilB-like protein